MNSCVIRHDISESKASGGSPLKKFGLGRIRGYSLTIALIRSRTAAAVGVLSEGKIYLRKGKAMANENECGHDLCTCQADGDSGYCSVHCKNAADQQLTELKCDCGHPGCNG